MRRLAIIWELKAEQIGLFTRLTIIEMGDEKYETSLSRWKYFHVFHISQTSSFFRFMSPPSSRFIPGSSILPQPMNEHRFNSKHISDSTIRIVTEEAGVVCESKSVERFLGMPSPIKIRKFTQKKAIKSLINYSNLFETEALAKLFIEAVNVSARAFSH